jgi:hypothetical protein
MRIALAAVLLAAACSPVPGSQRSLSPVPEISDPPPPQTNVLGALGGVVVDNDGDGNYFERCGGEAEDHDGYLDADGCADPDNDGDGILDERDACPDAGGTAAFNGCPDWSIAIAADLDGDGVAPAQDRCPGAAEDADGFDDGDGCPDADDDGDGFIDPLDACPRAPGHVDGCP